MLERLSIVNSMNNIKYLKVFQDCTILESVAIANTINVVYGVDSPRLGEGECTGLSRRL